MQQFTPLPLRARSVLELIDTSLKVYKQYFLVLLGWSAGIHLISVLPAISSWLTWLTWLAILLTPLKLSVAACCIAGAVRGQNVSFSQCWDFSKPRFGPMLGWLIIAAIIGFLGFLLTLVPGFILMVMTAAFSRSAGGGAVGVVGLVFAFILFFLAMSFGMVFMYAWAYMVPLVVCMEEGRATQGPMARTWALLRGNWGRLTGLMLVLGMAVLMIMLAMGATAAWGGDLDQLRRSITDGNPSPEFQQKILQASIGINFIMMFFEPAMMLALVLFYLDVRVRNEALDLEWSAHQSQPPEAPPSLAPAPAPMAPSLAYPTQGVFPMPAEPIREPMGVSSIAPPDSPAVPWQSLVEEPLPAPPTDAPLPGDAPTIACPKCGAISPATSTFCMTCGALLSSDA